MDAQTFLDNLSVIADTSGGVQRLEAIVANLGVRGLLVEQESTEQPASVLLDRIAEERTALVRSGRLRKQKARTSPSQPCPVGWESTDLGAILDLEYGKALPAHSRDEDGGVPVYGSNGIVGHHSEALVSKSCVVVGRKGSAGAVNVARGPSWPIDTTYFVEPLGGMTVDFLTLVLQASRLDRLDRATAVPGLNREDAYAIPVLLPPLAEQARIVAKVAELLRLCGELEARQQRRQGATVRFRGAAFHALTEAESPEDLGKAWTRVSTNWSALMDDAAGIRSLRPTVLQLAIEGRLVDRLPTEGTGQATIDVVEHERDTLARKGSIAKPKPRTDVTAEEQPFDIPAHWLWVHVEDVATHIVDCLHRTPPYADAGYPAIRTCDVEPGRVLVENALLVNEATFREQTRRLAPREGDVLYSREGGRFGIAAVVPAGIDLCLSQRMMQFRCAGGVVPEYFSWFLNSPLGFGQASEDVGGSASPHVNIKSIRRFVMPLPPTGEQSRIVEAVEELFGGIDQLATVSEHRDRVASQFADAVASASLTS